MGIFDVNRYNKDELQWMISSFVKKYDFLKMKKKIQKYKKKHIKYKEHFPYVYEISEEYYEKFKCNILTLKVISRGIQNQRKLPKEKDSLIQKCYERAYFLFWKDNEETEDKELQFGVENGSDEEIISKPKAFKKHSS